MGRSLALIAPVLVPTRWGCYTDDNRFVHIENYIHKGDLVYSAKTLIEKG